MNNPIVTTKLLFFLLFFFLKNTADQNIACTLLHQKIVIGLNVYNFFKSYTSLNNQLTLGAFYFINWWKLTLHHTYFIPCLAGLYMRKFIFNCILFLSLSISFSSLTWNSCNGYLLSLLFLYYIIVHCYICKRTADERQIFKIYKTVSTLTAGKKFYKKKACMYNERFLIVLCQPQMLAVICWLSITPMKTSQ